MSLTDLQPFNTERVWTVDDVPVLTATLTLPEPKSADDRLSRRFRRYYRLQHRAYLRYCESFLLPRAEAEYRAALAASTPLPCFRAELNYTLTYQSGTLLSLFVQARETMLPGRDHLVRRGDTWDLTAGYPLPLSACFPPRSHWKKAILTFAETEFHRRESLGFFRCHSGLRLRLRRHFNPQNYYLTEEGLVVFYPMHSIAPAVEGIPSIVLPYGQFGLRIPPRNEQGPLP